MGEIVNTSNQILLFAMFAVSLNLLMGYAGQASLAQAAFGAVGGYTAAVLAVHHGWAFVPAVLVAIVVAGVVGGLVSLPALRLPEQYLILLTIAVAFIVASLTQSIPSLGGQYGLQGLGPMEILGHEFETPEQIFWLLLAVGILVFVTCWRMGESAFGRVLRSLREDDAATRALGKNTVRFKVVVFGATAAVAGLAGALFVYYYQQVSPGQWTVQTAISMIAMVVLGGTGNLIGSVLGAVIIVSSTPILEKWVHLGASKATFAQLMIYGGALVLLMMFRPEGILKERHSRHQLRVSAADRASAKVELAAALAHEPASAPLAATSAAGSAALGTPAAGAASAGGRGPATGADVATADAAAPADLGAPTGVGAGVAGNGDANVAGDRRIALEVRGIQKHFGGIRAVNGVDLELPEHEVTALIGPNGAGKSTLFGLFTGFIPSDAGTVRLHGEPIDGLRPDVVARRGMVRSFQDVRLFTRLTVLENVLVGIPDQAGERLVNLYLRPVTVARSDAAARAEALRHLETVGMADKAGVMAADLAHGEQKLVAIARVLATGADLLLLDEPTSGIDPAWVDRIADTIRRLPELGKTVCIVEHNLAFLERLNVPCYFLEAGTVRQKGWLRDLMADEQLRHAYFGV